MKKLKCILLGFLVVLFAIFLYKTCTNIPWLIALASKKVASTEGIVQSRDEKKIYVSYSTENGNYNGSIDIFPNYYSVYKKGDIVSLEYNKDDNTILYEGSTPLIGDVIVLFLIDMFIFNNVLFIDIINTIKSRKWKKAEYSYNDTRESNNGYGYYVSVYHEENGKKIIESRFISSNIISLMIEEGIIDKVPVRINTKNNDMVIDYDEVYKKARINRYLV